MTELISLFFQNLGIHIEKLEIQDFSESISISLKSNDSALLIGMHGKNLESFSHILGRMIENERKKFIKVRLEINDYKKEKEDRLFQLIETKVSLILKSGEDIKIPNLSSYERKKVHDYIAEKKIEGLRTESKGEGVERTIYLVFSGKNKGTSISNKNGNTVRLLEEGVGI
ncbi:hypothetical protein KBB25_02150 [Candidatus Gracilibacteria bacterium]|nr:hypothetical protein [Candidatus Gracilibacteria bacterium]